VIEEGEKPKAAKVPPQADEIDLFFTARSIRQSAFSTLIPQHHSTPS
jgi:hypothetical protein